MTEAALALSIAAMVLAVATIFFDILFYRWQTEQGARITGTVNDFAKEMHGVLGEIKGLTTGTWQELREEFRFVLEKALNQERASIGEEVAPRVEAVEGQLDALEAKLSTTGHDELRTIVGELKRDVSSLQQGLAGLRQGAGAAKAPSHAPARRASLVIEPRQIAPGGSVRLRLFGGSSLLARTTCLVDTPDNNTFTAEFGTVSSAAVPLQPPVLVFPQDFEGASAEAAGAYDVAVYQTSALDVLAALGGGQTLLCTGSFVVEGGPKP